MPEELSVMEKAHFLVLVLSYLLLNLSLEVTSDFRMAFSLAFQTMSWFWQRKRERDSLNQQTALLWYLGSISTNRKPAHPVTPTSLSPMMINGSELSLNWHFLVCFLYPVLNGCYIAVSTWPTYEKTEPRAVLLADVWLWAFYTTLATEELAWNCIWSPERDSTAQPIVRYG